MRIELTIDTSIVLVEARDVEAREWIEEHVSGAGYQPDFPAKLIVEPRYAADLVNGFLEAGGEVE